MEKRRGHGRAVGKEDGKKRNKQGEKMKGSRRERLLRSSSIVHRTGNSAPRESSRDFFLGTCTEKRDKQRWNLGEERQRQLGEKKKKGQATALGRMVGTSDCREVMLSNGFLEGKEGWAENGIERRRKRTGGKEESVENRGGEKGRRYSAM